MDFTSGPIRSSTPAIALTMDIQTLTLCTVMIIFCCEVRASVYISTIHRGVVLGEERRALQCAGPH